jgi:hypothetical protein
MARQNVAEPCVDLLARTGVRRVYGVAGDKTPASLTSTDSVQTGSEPVVVHDLKTAAFVIRRVPGGRGSRW